MVKVTVCIGLIAFGTPPYRMLAPLSAKLPKIAGTSYSFKMTSWKQSDLYDYKFKSLHTVFF